MNGHRILRCKKHTIDEQVESYHEIQNYINEMGHNELFQVVYGKAVNDCNYLPFMGKFRLLVILNHPVKWMRTYGMVSGKKTLSEWPDDWEMQLHKITNQVETWLDINQL